MELKDYLKIMIMKDASDLYLTTGAPASAKIQGQLVSLESTPLPPGRVEEIAYQIMDDDQKHDFKDRPECNMAISEPGIGRFRVNIFKQRNQFSMVLRSIKTDIPINLPALNLGTDLCFLLVVLAQVNRHRWRR